MSLTNKLSSFLKSPQGQQLAGKAKAQLAKPENKRRLAELQQKLTKRK